MAVRIFEYATTRKAGALPIRPISLARQAGVVGASSAASSAFTDTTRHICIQTDSEVIHIARGTAPVATTSDYKLSANNGYECDMDVEPGWKIAWIQGT